MDALQRHLAQHLARLTGRHISTVRRWIRTGRFPPWVDRLQHIASDLGELEPTWSGWALRAGKLVSPEGWQFKPGEIRAIPFLRARLNAYEIKLSYPLQADWVDRRYVEVDVSAAA